MVEKSKRKPRIPTDEEKEQIANVFGNHFDESPIEVQRLFVEDASIAVFDNYITDGPGYFGKVVVVVWSGAPEFVNVLTNNSEGKLEIRDIEV